MTPETDERESDRSATRNGVEEPTDVSVEHQTTHARRDEQDASALTAAEPTPAPPCAVTGAALRTAVLDAARVLLIDAGYRELSMRDVAKRVGCSVSSIYLYFANKDALIHALIDEGFEKWYDAQLAAEAGATSARERLERTCRAYIAFGLANPEYYEIMFMFHPGQMGRYPKELYRRARRGMLHLADVLAEFAPSLGPVTEQDVHVAAGAVWATLHGVTSTIITGRLDRRIDQARYVDGAVAYAMRGVAERA